MKAATAGTLILALATNIALPHATLTWGETATMSCPWSPTLPDTSRRAAGRLMLLLRRRGPRLWDFRVRRWAGLPRRSRCVDSISAPGRALRLASADRSPQQRALSSRAAHPSPQGFQKELVEGRRLRPHVKASHVVGLSALTWSHLPIRLPHVMPIPPADNAMGEPGEAMKLREGTESWRCLKMISGCGGRL